MSLSLKPKIFVVDDTRTFRAILKEALGELNDQIELIGEASDGLEALKSPFLPEADIVLLDIYLPNLNGLEVLKEMKKRFLKRPFS
jgi:YesN/AraC family two-component response regulator